MTAEYESRVLDRIILSVHVPKTAGTTLLELLRRTVGSNAVLADYAEDPSFPESPRNLDPEGYFSRSVILPAGTLAVHGHFHINKYSTYSSAFRMTFLRDPVDTILSIHKYWQTLNRSYNSLQDYFLRNQLDVFETARLPLLRNMLSRNYFGGVDMGTFDFIGRYEAFAEDLAVLSLRLGISLDADIHLNKVNKDEQSSEILSDVPKTRTRLRDILIDDVKFYEAAIARRPI